MSEGSVISINKAHTEELNQFVSFDAQGNGVSRVFDLEWDFTAKDQSTTHVSFRGITEEWREASQVYMHHILESVRKSGDTEDDLAISSLNRAKGSLFAIMTALGYSDLTQLSKKSVWREFKIGIKGKYSEASLNNIGGVLNYLSKAGVIHRFVKPKKELYSLANDNNNMQHIAIPEGFHSEILKRISKTVDVYHPYRHEISDCMEKYFGLFEIESNKVARKNGAFIPTNKHKKAAIQRVRKYAKSRIKHDIPEFFLNRGGAWIKEVLVDCFILVGLFSGARRGEIQSFSSSSYTTIGGVPVLRGKTTKGNSGVPITDTWITHPIIEKCLELAFDMTNNARKKSINALELALQEGEINRSRYKRGINQLSSAFIPVSKLGKIKKDYVFVPPTNLNLEKFNLKATQEDVDEFNRRNPIWAGTLKLGGSLPKLNPHALRRTFAVFMVKNKLGGTQAIRYQFKHGNPEMSSHYANHAILSTIDTVRLDLGLYEDVEDELIAMGVDAWDEIYNESETLSGLEGERILQEREAKKRIEKLRQGEKVVFSRSELEDLVRGGAKSIVLLPTGAYCSNSSCERICSIETFVAESKPCDYEIITDKGAKRIAKQRTALIRSFRAMNSMKDYAYSRILSGYKEKILVIELTLQKHGIEYDVFKDEIMVTA